MANTLENKSFTPTGMEIVLYNDQEAQNLSECANNVIVAEPVSWRKPKEAFGAAEGGESTGKRKRCTSDLDEVEKEYEFSLYELYKTHNINEIISRTQKDETTIDPQELLNNLKGWTVEKRKRNGEDKFDKTYRHPKSKRMLRSLVKVKKFIEEKSCVRKTSYTTKGISLQDIGVAMPKRQLESHDARPSCSYNETNMYLQIFKRYEEALAQEKRNSYNKFSPSSSSDRWETGRASNANNREKEIMNGKLNEVPQSRQIRDLSKEQVFTGLMKSHEQEGVRTFGVAPSALNDFGASSSSINRTSSDEIKLLVESQVEAQLQTRVEKLVEEKVSQYEKTHREMVEKMNGMHRLLLLQGLLPLTQFPNTQ